MNKQTSTKPISKEEQSAIDKINLEQSGLKEKDLKEKESAKDSDTKIDEKETAPKKQKHSGNVLQEGITDGKGAFIPYENGKLPEVYKDSHKDWKKYKRYSDGSIQF